MTETDQYCPHGLAKRHCPSCAWAETDRLRAENMGLRAELASLQVDHGRVLTDLDSLRAENVRLREVLSDLRRNASLLQQTAEACAINHYGHDFELLSLPRWLSGPKASIDRALEVLGALEQSGPKPLRPTSDRKEIDAHDIGFTLKDDSPREEPAPPPGKTRYFD